MADVDSEAGDAADQGSQAVEAWTTFLAAAPLSAEARRDLLKLHRERPDPLPALGPAAKKDRLARLSYADFLTGPLGLHKDVLPFLQARTHTLYGVGIDAVSAQDAWGLGLPGFAGMGLDRTAGPGMGLDARPYPDKTPYFFHFPDGNATLARLLVRGLVPAAVPGRDAEDVVLSQVDYSRLDDTGAPARIRLSSTVVRVRHVGDPRFAREVEVAYVRRGRLESVRTARAVIACWHVVVPYICPELPEAQKEALSSAAKVPLLYTSVLLGNWRAWHALRVSQVHCPGGFHVSANLGLPVAIGGYRTARRPDEPVFVHMVRTPCSPGLPARDQHRLGRVELYETPFEALERRVRDQLARMLGPGGFDPARDIRAITVNRWPHGYAYQYNSLWDPFWLEGKGPLPCETARQPFGRLAIANADAAAYAYTDAAFDQAWRAVQELARVS
jgi:spermidine dehydrogenase